MRERDAASNDYIRGDTTTLRDMLTGQDPAPFMSPGGDLTVGRGRDRLGPNRRSHGLRP